ncbi:MAG: hypothetical protein R3A48_28470 [Polyangiales bacterium]
MLDELDADPGIDRQEREARVEHAKGLQRAWGCPAAKQKPITKLTRGQREDIEDFERVTRSKAKGNTCPLAATRRPAPWLSEVTAAVRVMERTKGSITFRQIVGASRTSGTQRSGCAIAVNDARGSYRRQGA